jgi:pantoate--beta-alanine ligase
MQRAAEEERGRGKVGFVPTMGYLHEGHLALVRAAKKRADSVVVSVFVNPMQFGEREDLARYPRDARRDSSLLREEGTDVLFIPSVEELYPDGYSTRVAVDHLTDGLCGSFRPGHFTGVTTVLAKLFNAVRPHYVFMGQKDAQQAVVVERMARDLDYGMRVVTVPTVREADGLAMSSRNTRLTPGHRRQAPVLYEALKLARRMVRDGERSPARLRSAIRGTIERGSDFRIQYVAIVGASDLRPVRRLEGRVLVALAGFFGRVRLIDNVVFRA